MWFNYTTGIFVILPRFSHKSCLVLAGNVLLLLQSLENTAFFSLAFCTAINPLNQSNQFNAGSQKH